MVTVRLAFRNLLGAGIRTWLNVIVLSMSFVAIIWLQGLYEGMGDQVSRAMIESEIGGGQYWHASFDPYDPLSLEDSHATLPPDFQALVKDGQAVPILMAMGTIYPHGRFHPVIVKGITPEQEILGFPTSYLAKEGNATVPAVIGRRMARATRLQEGDLVTLRWRDVDGTFDAADVEIVHIMNTIVPSIDRGVIWLPLEKLQQMLGAPDEATMVVLKPGVNPAEEPAGWIFRDQDYLLKDVRAMVRGKSAGATIFYVILLFLALLAIFDTQVLSIFRRRKEIGTLIALGMTRSEVIKLFTLEGLLHGILAGFVALIYGLPLMLYSKSVGWGLPAMTDQYGFAFGDRLFPIYTANLVVFTTIFILISVTVVSYLPTRKIAKLNPTDALRGRRTW